MTLDLHHPMIQFLINGINESLGAIAGYHQAKLILSRAGVLESSVNWFFILQVDLSPYVVLFILKVMIPQEA